MPSAYFTDRTPKVPLQMRIPVALLEKIDTWGKDSKMPSRSEAIRELINKGLESASK